MSAEILDDVTILAMRLCATRHDAMVSGEAFIGLLSKLLRTAVGEALAAAAKPPTWNAVDYHSARADLTPLAEPTVDNLTADELTELTRRCDIVTNNRALSIPYDWARQRGEELGVPATTIFSALTKSTKPRKERDPVKALEAPQPRVRRMYGNNYGGANE